MEFLKPGFLYALFALAIPIIVHLFNFRRFKRIAFTNVRFLKEVKQQTQNHDRLKHILVLISRLLAITFLVLAFAQPYIPLEGQEAKKGKQAVSIFLDNSFSMEGEGSSGVLLEIAKNRAIDVAQTFSNTDRFQILTQDLEGKHQHLIGQEEFKNWVTEIEPSSQSQSLENIYQRQADLLKSAEEDAVLQQFIISDFQKSRYDLENIPVDTTSTLSLVLLERNSPANLYIDSVWFESPIRKLGGADKIKVRIANQGPDDVENIPLRLQINGKQSAIGSFAVNSYSETDTVLNFVNDKPGIQRAVVAIEDYPVTYDDSYYLSYTVYEEIDILAIQESSGEQDFLAKVFRGDSTMNYQTSSVRGISYSELPEKDLIVLYEVENIPSGLSAELSSFAKNGGSVWIIPGKEINRESYNEFLTRIQGGAILSEVEKESTVRSLNSEHPVYRGIFEKLPNNLDLPKASKYYKISNPVKSTDDALMRFGSGDAFLTEYSAGQGKVYLQAVPLRSNENNFSRHALFVASALRMAELSRSTRINALEIDDQAYFTIAGNSPGNESVFHLISEDGEIDIIPSYQARNGRVEINPGPSFNRSGNYFLKLGEDTLSAVGINYPRSESNLESYTRSELEEVIGTRPNIRVYDGNDEKLERKLSKQATGTELWKICLILVLVFLLIESLLLRFWKKRIA